jgi:hypothetical protein
MEEFLVIGNSAVRSAGGADRTMTMTAAIGPRPAFTTIASWYTYQQGLSREQAKVREDEVRYGGIEVPVAAVSRHLIPS